MRISAISTYPVKGCHRLEHDAAEVEPWGLAGDRRWMFVTAEGVGITQRETARLTQLAVRPVADGLILSAPGMPTLHVPFPREGRPIDVRVFKSQPAAPARVAESAWCSEFLGRDTTLTWQEDPDGRLVDGVSLPTDRVSLADGYPVLLGNAGSLDSLNDWLAEAGDEPVPMTRFRPNLVVSGAPAWAEDSWIGRELLIGDVTFRAASHCGRCVVTTIDQETGEKQRQPLKMLGKHRKIDGQLMFAVNLLPSLPPDTKSIVRLGDPVTVLPEDVPGSLTES